ncbi:MAG TPA: lipo-like protein, partial [Gammaproteobacteria bacterium]|nr:lipo-like protein [Gammaproteobacteria bacterium]
MNVLMVTLGRTLAHYLNQPVRGYEPFAISNPSALAAVLQPGDVLLVE